MASVNKYGRIGFLYIFAWEKSAASENKRSDNARFLPEVTMDLCFNLKLKFQFKFLGIVRNNDTLPPFPPPSLLLLHSLALVVLSICKANRTQSLSQLVLAFLYMFWKKYLPYIYYIIPWEIWKQIEYNNSNSTFTGMPISTLNLNKIYFFAYNMCIFQILYVLVSFTAWFSHEFRIEITS